MIAIVREGDEHTTAAERIVTHSDGTQSIDLPPEPGQEKGRVLCLENAGWGTRPAGTYGGWERGKPNGAFLLYRNDKSGLVRWVRVFEQVP